jgi:hypothetical protein
MGMNVWPRENTTNKERGIGVSLGRDIVDTRKGRGVMFTTINSN